MRHILPFFLILIFCSCSETEKTSAESQKTSRFSPEFNSSFSILLNDYYALSELFVKWDSAAISPAAATMIKELDNLLVEKDSIVKTNFLATKNVLNSELFTIMQQDIILENKKRAFSRFSENFYNFLQNIKYDAAKIYLNECKMPYNDTGRAVWLSRVDSIRNPYLGMHHPRYGSGMLECGTREGTIDFKIAD